MRWFSFTVILFIAMVLEAGILVTLLVYYSFSCRARDAIICSFLIGFAADLTGGVMGPHMICFGLLGFLLNQSNQILFAKRAIYKALIVFAIYLIAETFSHWLGLLKGLDAKDSYYSIMLFTAVYSAVISPIIWSILSAVSGGFAAMKALSDRTYR